jgi:hypothetical protein
MKFRIQVAGVTNLPNRHEETVLDDERIQ